MKIAFIVFLILTFCLFTFTAYLLSQDEPSEWMYYMMLPSLLSFGMTILFRIMMPRDRFG